MLVSLIDRLAQVGASAVPPAPVGVQSQREVQCSPWWVLGGAWQLDNLVSADAAGIDGLQPGQVIAL